MLVHFLDNTWKAFASQRCSSDNQCCGKLYFSWWGIEWTSIFLLHTFIAFRLVRFLILSQLTGNMLVAKWRHLFWLPCATHCIDLTLEVMGNIPPIARTLQKGMTIVSYIYKHVSLINMLNEHTNKKNLLTSVKNWFATSYLTLKRIQQLKHNLRTMFTSEKWGAYSYAKELQGKRVSDISWQFLEWCSLRSQIDGPLVKVLRLVDNEKKLAMGYIHMRWWSYRSDLENFWWRWSMYEDVFAIIDKGWED